MALPAAFPARPPLPPSAVPGFLGWGDSGVVGFSSPAAGERDGRRGFPRMWSNSADARELLPAGHGVAPGIEVAGVEGIKNTYYIYIYFFPPCTSKHGSTCTCNSLFRVAVMQQPLPPLSQTRHKIEINTRICPVFMANDKIISCLPVQPNPRMDRGETLKSGEKGQSFPANEQREIL